MAPLIQGCIDELIKLILLDNIPQWCSTNPKLTMCNPQFQQELRELPRCDVYRPPKSPKRLSEYQMHMGACLKKSTFDECKRLWNIKDEQGNHPESMAKDYKGTGYTGGGGK